MRVGFSGSRSLPSSFLPLVAKVLSSLPEGAEVLVGDAKGLDSLVRSLCPQARVFSPRFPRRGGFAARSAELVRESDILFVSSPCPDGVRPSRSFRGCGSGSWGSAALAAGLGKPVQVFWCGEGQAVFPSWLRQELIFSLSEV